MKEIFISSLCDYIGKEISFTVFLKDIILSENRHKTKWLELIASDKSGEIIMRIWSEQIDDKYFDLKGKVIKVLGMVSCYQGNVEVQVVALEEKKNFDWTDYVISLPKEDVDMYCNQLADYIEMITDDKLKELVIKIYSKQRIGCMAIAIGGTLHHNYFGGLLVHTLETCAAAIDAIKLADMRSCNISTYELPINKDLVIAGALLHDVGKLNTYGGFPNGERTERGFLVGSTVDSVLYVTTFNSMLPKEKQVSDLGPLDHIILTAESMDEKGTLPRTLEAVIVNEANRESVKLDGFMKMFNDSDRKVGDRRKYLYSKLNRTTIMREV